MSGFALDYQVMKATFTKANGQKALWLLLEEKYATLCKSVEPKIGLRAFHYS